MDFNEWDGMIVMGIDNGVSGSLGWVSSDGSVVEMTLMPTKSEQNYTKTKRNITRIDWVKLDLLFASFPRTANIKVFLERPLVNPMRFMATTSALRALEAALIIVEKHRFPIQYVDSRQWQKVMLPQGCKGTAELKKASADIGKRLFPKLTTIIEKHGDADGVLMAEAARRGRW